MKIDQQKSRLRCCYRLHKQYLHVILTQCTGNTAGDMPMLSMFISVWRVEDICFTRFVVQMWSNSFAFHGTSREVGKFQLLIMIQLQIEFET